MVAQLVDIVDGLILPATLLAASPLVGFLLGYALAGKKYVRQKWPILVVYYSVVVIEVVLLDLPYGFELVSCLTFIAGPCLALAFFFMGITSRNALIADKLALSLCKNCGYNLTGNVSGICPECGETIEDQTE
jgi:hypothetical protein